MASTPIKPDLAEARRLLLARRLKGMAAAEEESRRIKPRAPGTVARISVDQYRIWLHQSMYPELPIYNEPVSVFYAGALDPDILKTSLEYFVQRHEAWRTCFRESEGRVLQQVLPTLEVPVQFVDLSHLSDPERMAEDLCLATKQASQPFDLKQAPLFRVLLTRLGPAQSRIHFVIHHITFDGTAIRDSLLPELASIYNTLAAGGQPDLPAREIQYSDYSIWRSEQLSSPSMQRATEFWRSELAGDLEVLRLPTDRPRPALLGQRGSMVMFTFSDQLTDALRALSYKQGVSLYMTLLASLHVLLFRYSGQRDVVIGTGANGRRLPELAGMLGYMLDTFPVRTHPDPEESFLLFLTEVRSTLLAALDASEVPFDRIFQGITAKRDPSYHPIFQTFFSFLSPILDSPAGWDLQPKIIDTGCTKFDLYIEAEERHHGAAACILYNTDLFDRATIERMAGHWTSLLEAIVANPETRLRDLPLLTSAERQQMLVQWNETVRPVPSTTMHGLFRDQALRTPDAIAVQFEKNRLTYKQLDDRSERFAALFRQAGAGPGKLVAICIDRSENLLAGLLGILKTGAAYLPLDPGTPLSRITMCLEDAEPAVLLTQRKLLEQLPTGNATVLLIDDLLQDAADLPAGFEPVTAGTTPDETAYIIHTSGSTGRPKAVELPHGAVVNLLLSMQHEPGLKPSDTLVAVTTVSFDIAVLELFLPVITGAKVVIADRATALDPFELSDLIDSSKCTVIQATPATWRSMMAIEWEGKPGLKILCGGEALPRDLADKLLARGIELWNVYGPTETTIWSTVLRVEPGKGAVPVGRPIDNTTTYILDANQQPVPVNVPGELYIGGIGVAKGYRGQPDLTAEKFVTPEISLGERIYRTGDYALYRANGIIECQGRADNQVKVRGYRIELEEVELHLSAHPGVIAAAARVWKDDAVGNRLTGYIVPKPGFTPEVKELRRFLHSRLPEYMIPTDFVVLDKMPLTPNGKTDRKLLPAEGPRATASAPEPDEPMNEVETRLAKIWCDVLHVPSVRRDDDFFSLGGHSLLLVTLFSRINKEFGSNLPITTIFDAQTLSVLAEALEEKVNISSLVPVQTNGTRLPLFMAHSYLLYYSLSNALGNDQPFYGLRELEKDEGLSIEERARKYIETMREVQPHGPYRIAGWCAAGPLAVEISRQLKNDGEEIGLLLLFDAWLPDYLKEARSAARSHSMLKVVAGKLKRFAAASKNLDLKTKIASAWHRMVQRLKTERDEFYIRNWTQVNRWSARLHIPLPQFMHNTTLTTFAAMREFQARKLPLKITLLRAKDSVQPIGASESCGWERVAEDGVEVLWAPGDHESMFRGANLGATTRMLQQLLN